MKEFACGDVVPGRKARFRASAEDEILGQVARHAQDDHGLLEIPPELVQAVRDNIHTVLPE